MASLREEGVAVIVSGMAVHNLRDLRFHSFNDPKPLSYITSFDQALKEAVETDPDQREEAMAKLLSRPDARKAHLGFEHLLPVFIGAGAAGEDKGKRLWTLGEGSVSWAQYRFGDIAVN